jgi:hypothetical protein
MRSRNFKLFALKREVNERDLSSEFSLEAAIVISLPGRHEVRVTQLDMAKYFEKKRSVRIFSFLLYLKKSTTVVLDSKFLLHHQLQ